MLYFGASDEHFSQSLSWIDTFLEWKGPFLPHAHQRSLGELQDAKTQLIKLNYLYEAADCLLLTFRCWALESGSCG